MSDSENILQKAFYFGVGMASYAAEKAGETLKELKQEVDNLSTEIEPVFPQLQQLADEIVTKGKMATDEARSFVDDMIKQGQLNNDDHGDEQEQSKKPRIIEIINDDDD